MSLTNTLISLVENNPHLYRKDLKGFKDEQMKKNTWENIASAIDRTDEFAKRRWFSLRDRFVRAYRQMKEMPASDTGCQINFPHFNQMMWLAPHIRRRRTNGFSPKPKNGQSSGSHSQSSGEVLEVVVSPELCEEYQEATPPSSPVEANSGPQPVPLVMWPTKRPKEPNYLEPQPDGFFQQKKMDKLVDTLTHVVQTFSKLVDKQVTPVPNTSTAMGQDPFLSSVALDMASLSKVNQIRFKKKVLENLEELLVEQDSQK